MRPAPAVYRLVAQNPVGVFIALAAVIVLVLGTLLVAQALAAHAAADRLQRANTAVDALLDAAADLARERGLTAAALGGVPRAEIEDHLEAVRRRGDAHWYNALTLVEALAGDLSDSAALEAYHRHAYRAWESFLAARAHADRALEHGNAAALGPGQWIDTVTQLIAASAVLRDQTLLSVDAPMDVVRLNVSVKRSAWMISENAGQARAILAFYAGTRAPMHEGLLEQAYGNRRAITHHLEELLALREIPDTPDHLRHALDTVLTEMEHGFQPTLSAMLAAAHDGAYPMDPLEWFDTATGHIDQVLAASAIVSRITTDRVHERARRAYATLGAFATLTLLAAVLALVSMLHIQARAAQWRRTEAREQQRNRILTALATGRPLREILELIVTSMEEEDPTAYGSILLVDEETRQLVTGAAPRLPDFYNQAVDGTPIGDGTGSCGTAAHTGRRVVVEDIRHHPYWKDFRGLAERAGVRSCWSEPVVSATGDVIATFAIYHPEPRTPHTDDIERIQRAADLASLAIQRKRLEAELERRASHDHLTGLFNRETFEQMIHAEILRTERYGTRFSMIMLDIDHFKPINDRYGHAIGDEVLIRFARTVKEQTRATDTLSRWGGEEFMLLLPETDIEGAAQLAEETRQRVAKVDFPEVGQVTVSLGVAEYRPPENARNLLKRLDDALYEAKEGGRNRVVTAKQSAPP